MPDSPIRSRARFIWRYLRGHTPWDSGIVPPEVTGWIAAHEAAGAPPGRALDLGCGTGTTSIDLASRGWEAVGIDFAVNAIRRARRKARRSGVADRAIFHTADVTRLDFLPDHPPFDLVVDIGCLHAIPDARRAAYAAHVTRLTRPGATYLLYAFMPRLRRNGQLMGIDPAGVAALFDPAFEIDAHIPGLEVTTPVPSAWYTLRRTDRV